MSQISSSSGSNNLTTQNSHEDEIDLRQLLAVLIDGRYIIAASVLIMLFLGIIYVLLATPIYKANAVIQIEDNAPGIPGIDDMKDIFSSESSSATELHVIKSRLVIGSVVDELNLTINLKEKFAFLTQKRVNKDQQTIEVSQLELPDHLLESELKIRVEKENNYSLWLDDQELIRGVSGKLAFNGNIIILVKIFSASENSEFVLTKANRLKTILDLQSRLKVSEKGKDTGIVEISIEGSNKKRIAQVVDAVAANYYFQNIQRMSEQAEKSLIFLDEQIPRIQKKLLQSEEALNKFRSRQASIDLSLEAKTALDVLVQIEADIIEMEMNEADISRRFTSQHPNYISFKRQQRNLLNEREKVNKKIEGLPDTQKKILRLKREFEVNQSIFITLQNKRQELSIASASTVGNVRIVDKAEVLPDAVAPKKTLTVLLATILGLMFGVALVAARNILKPGIKDPNELTNNGLTVYAMVPLSENERFNEKRSKLTIRWSKSSQKGLRNMQILAHSHPADLSIEALRSLRTSLHFMMLEATNNVLMVTSASPGVGKSFISLNLAAVIAGAGHKVLVIDADMRKGYAHQRFGLSANNGLSEILQDNVKHDQAIKATEIPGLDVLTRGKIPLNPSELLMGSKFQLLLEALEKKYDQVIVDTPPILAVTDASIIGKYVGASLIVARSESCTAKQILTAHHRFDLNGINVNGVVLNAVVKKAGSYYYDYGYYGYEYKSNEG